MGYLSAQEYLKSIKKKIVERNIFDGSINENSVYQQKILNRIESEDLKGAKDTYLKMKKNSYEDILGLYLNNYFKVLPNDITNLLNTKIAVGCISDYNINAACFKSEDGYYAIVLNNGLFYYLNKAIKYIIGLKFPDSIYHCDEFEISELTRDKLNKIRNDLRDSYINFSVPIGPKILLNQSYMGMQASFIAISEIFIMCHELGHILNKDLDSEKFTYMIDNDKNLNTLRNNLSYQKEFDADIKGFEILLIIVRKALKINEEALLPILTICFDIIGDLYGDNSSSHPNPRDRVLNIAYNFYEEDTFKELYDSYYDMDSKDIFSFASKLKPKK